MAKVNTEEKIRTGTKISIWAITGLLFMAFIRIIVLPMLVGGEKLQVIESQTPRLITHLLWAAVVFFWGNEGRKTIETIFTKRQSTGDSANKTAVSE